MTNPEHLDALMHQLADRLDMHPLTEWGPELLAATIALLDLHFAGQGTGQAVVLQLVKR